MNSYATKERNKGMVIAILNGETLKAQAEMGSS